MATFSINIPDEVSKRLEGYRRRIMRYGLYREPSRSSVITQAIIEFLDKHDKPEKQMETD